ncbi:uncharacterized protein LOC105287898 isoform X2 [Ooceraea biroi]|uniref:uncharacterized protein LOC105287898 isoform X2 n=1 Tax=Ooceraea biroi TaxID=2015173 RepID=UPI000F093CD7|nr:uncharacterized protein LOC105287898 isoform X2 [Ooceraea biroi]
METFVQCKNISLHDEEDNNQQLIDLKLLDEATNVQYNIKVQKEMYTRAHNDMIFATTLLEKAKTLLNSKDTYNSVSPKNIMANDSPNLVKPSLSTSVVLNDTENILQDNTTSDSENISDTQDTEVNKEKWEHRAILLLISLYKEKSYMLQKGSHKKLWTEISQCMKEKKYKFTGSQCNNKMDALKRRYRQIIDHNAQSGNDRKEWIYLDVLDEILRKKNWIKPLAVAGSNIKESEHSPLTDNNDENEPPTIMILNVTCQRKTCGPDITSAWLYTSRARTRVCVCVRACVLR